MSEKIVIGDDYRTRGFECTLKLNGATFAIDAGATLISGLIDPETDELVLGPWTIDKTELGTDLAASKVYFGPDAATTSAAKRTGERLKLHIELTQGTVKNTFIDNGLFEIVANSLT